MLALLRVLARLFRVGRQPAAPTPILIVTSCTWEFDAEGHTVYGPRQPECVIPIRPVGSTVDQTLRFFAAYSIAWPTLFQPDACDYQSPITRLGDTFEYTTVSLAGFNRRELREIYRRVTGGDES